jgi:hypothetical protein
LFTANYGASSSAPSRKESRVSRFADDVVGHGGDEEQNERAHRHTGLTDDDDDDYNREPPMHGRGNGAESASFMDEPADGRKHLRDKAAEFWHVVKLVTATIKQSMLALLNLVWQILLHESHKYATFTPHIPHSIISSILIFICFRVKYFVEYFIILLMLL